MTEQELIIGEKYVPIRKTDLFPLEASLEWQMAVKKGQYFLYYQGIYKEDGDIHYLFSASKELPLDGDYFNPSDVIPYIDPIAKYKLLVQKYEELNGIYDKYIDYLKYPDRKREAKLIHEINELKKELE